MSTPALILVDEMKRKYVTKDKESNKLVAYETTFAPGKDIICLIFELLMETTPKEAPILRLVCKEWKDVYGAGTLAESRKFVKMTEMVSNIKGRSKITAKLVAHWLRLKVWRNLTFTCFPPDLGCWINMNVNIYDGELIMWAEWDNSDFPDWRLVYGNYGKYADVVGTIILTDERFCKWFSGAYRTMKVNQIDFVLLDESYKTSPILEEIAFFWDSKTISVPHWNKRVQIPRIVRELKFLSIPE